MWELLCLPLGSPVDSCLLYSVCSHHTSDASCDSEARFMKASLASVRSDTFNPSVELPVS